MADRYLDHGVYTYAATPTWGVPQEGDGTASTPAAASATCSVDLSGATFVSGSSQISVMGATALTVSGSANSATNVQYSATLTTMIDNIVTVINTLATATIVNRPAGWHNPQIRDAVFARRVGNSIELMTRSGSASWNGLTAITWANVTGASSGTWAGGSGGCWGWLFNGLAQGTIWPSAWAQGTYTSLGTPLAGLPSTADTTYAKADNQSISLNTGAARDITFRTNLCVDSTGLIWPSAAGKTLTILLPGGTGHNTQLNFLGTFDRLAVSATSKGGLIVRNSTVSSNHSITFTAQVGARGFAFRNVLFLDDSSGAFPLSSSAISFAANAGQTVTAVFSFLGGCEYRSTRAVSNIILFGYGNSGQQHLILMDDFDFTFPAASGIQLGLLPVGEQWSVRASNVRMTSPATFQLVRRGGMSFANRGFAQIDNVRGFDMRVVSSIGHQGAGGTGTAGLDRQFSILTNAGPDSAFRIEGNTHVVDWLPGNQYPSLDCTTPAGTPWSWRWGWSGDTNLWVCRPQTNVLRLNARSIAGNAARTITLELLVPPGLNLDTSLVSMRVAYEGPSGLAETDNAAPPFCGVTPVALAASSAAWDKGAYPTYEAVKLTLTTPTAVTGGSDMSIELVCSGPCPGGANSLFINPRVAVA
ncbi:MAG: hypothetical protein C0423_01945 [Methylibium sp.]|nr:hypothetical protein [Methylibium sp.]